MCQKVISAKISQLNFVSKGEGFKPGPSTLLIYIFLCLASLGEHHFDQHIRSILVKTKGLRFLGFVLLGSVYEAHQEANRRSKTVTLKTEPPKTEPI